MNVIIFKFNIAREKRMKFEKRRFSSHELLLTFGFRATRVLVRSKSRNSRIRLPKFRPRPRHLPDTLFWLSYGVKSEGNSSDTRMATPNSPRPSILLLFPHANSHYLVTRHVQHKEYRLSTTFFLSPREGKRRNFFSWSYIDTNGF